MRGSVARSFEELRATMSPEARERVEVRVKAELARMQKRGMAVGTKSVLFGAHCFFLHPFFVARAWWKLYGFPWDLRLWAAFFLHDIGYLGKANMDGPEGESHPEVGARIMQRLFDRDRFGMGDAARYQWYDFCLYHSRYYAKKHGAPFSKLCVADKLAFVLTPRWLYLPMVTWTGEINEYLENAQTVESNHWKPSGYDKKAWHSQLKQYMLGWVAAHKDGAEDTWTRNRGAAT
jgi:hypothetical protein